jgi:iron transport multicopper oxidase
VTGWLVYDSTKSLPTATLLDKFSDFDDFDLVPYDKQALFPAPDQTITLDVVMDVLGNGQP